MTAFSATSELATAESPVIGGCEIVLPRLIISLSSQAINVVTGTAVNLGVVTVSTGTVRTNVYAGPPIGTTGGATAEGATGESPTGGEFVGSGVDISIPVMTVGVTTPTSNLVSGSLTDLGRVSFGVTTPTLEVLTGSEIDLGVVTFGVSTPTPEILHSANVLLPGPVVISMAKDDLEVDTGTIITLDYTYVYVGGGSTADSATGEYATAEGPLLEQIVSNVPRMRMTIPSIDTKVGTLVDLDVVTFGMSLPVPQILHSANVLLPSAITISMSESILEPLAGSKIDLPGPIVIGVNGSIAGDVVAGKIVDLGYVTISLSEPVPQILHSANVLLPGPTTIGLTLPVVNIQAGGIVDLGKVTISMAEQATVIQAGKLIDLSTITIPIAKPRIEIDSRKRRIGAHIVAS